MGIAMARTRSIQGRRLGWRRGRRKICTNKMTRSFRCPTMSKTRIQMSTSLIKMKMIIQSQSLAQSMNQQSSHRIKEQDFLRQCIITNSSTKTTSKSNKNL